jgi:hypothetical protein
MRFPKRPPFGANMGESLRKLKNSSYDIGFNPVTT